MSSITSTALSTRGDQSPLKDIRGRYPIKIKADVEIFSCVLVTVRKIIKMFTCITSLYFNYGEINVSCLLDAHNSLFLCLFLDRINMHGAEFCDKGSSTEICSTAWSHSGCTGHQP